MLDDVKIVCRRCGMTEFLAPEKRKPKDDLCLDCRRKPAKTINYGLGKSCRPWHGEFDVEDNPMLNGVLFMPGERVCKHRDCCEISHIVGAG